MNHWYVHSLMGVVGFLIFCALVVGYFKLVHWISTND